MITQSPNNTVQDRVGKSYIKCPLEYQGFKDDYPKGKMELYLYNNSLNGELCGFCGGRDV